MSLLLSILLAVPLLSGDEKRVMVVPQLQSGQVLRYDVQQVKTDTCNAPFQASQSASLDAHGVVKVEVLAITLSTNEQTFQLRTTFESFVSDTTLRAPGTEKGQTGKQGHSAEKMAILATIHADGTLDPVQGLDALVPEQQRLWCVWMNLFKLYTQFARQGVAQGQGWSSQEPELAPVDLASLFWANRFNYTGTATCQKYSMNL